MSAVMYTFFGAVLGYGMFWIGFVQGHRHGKALGEAQQEVNTYTRLNAVQSLHHQTERELWKKLHDKASA